MRLSHIRICQVALVISLACTIARANTIYVNRAATGNANGSSWADAYLKIGDAASNAAPGDQIWVARGTYVENIDIPDGVALYGGFAGTETDFANRNPSVNFTSIDAGKAGTAVRFATPAGPDTILDGFRIRNGLPDDAGGGGVYIDGGINGQGPVVSNNVISENAAGQGAGVIIRNCAPTIANNLFHDNTADNGAAINIYQNDPGDVLKIVNNTFVDNHSGDGGFVIGISSNANVLFANNLVAFNDRQIYLAYNDSGALYSNNDAWQNSDFNYFGPDPTGTGGNISEDPMFQDRANKNYRLAVGSPAIDMGDNDAVIGDFDLDHGERIQNSIVDIGAYENNGTGNHIVFAQQPGKGTAYTLLIPQPVIHIEDNTGVPVSGYNGPVTLSIDPGSGDPNGTLSGTTTVNAVDGVATFTDISVTGSGTGFVLDATTADTPPEQSMMFDITGVRLYVSKSGVDTNDGLSWATSKLTVQAAIDAGASEIWIATGTYTENLTVANGISFYGSFAGTETDPATRDLIANPTILDGGHTGSVLTSTGTTAGLAVQRVDGFTIQNGLNTAGPGGGLNLPLFNGTIANCTIQANSASTNGGGIFTQTNKSPSPVSISLLNDVIANNTAAQGGGIYLDVSSNDNVAVNVSLTNTTIHANTAATGGGAYFLGDVSLTGCTMDGNTASVGGGAFHQSHTLYAYTCAFTNNGITNSPDDAMGGAVFTGDSSGFQPFDSTFTGNHVSAIAGKQANGGFWATVNNGSVWCMNNVISGNSAALGGALYAKHGGNLTFYGCKWQGNTASGNGGALWVSQGPLSLLGNLLAGNAAGGYGGAIALDTAPVAHDAANNVTLQSCTIASNTAPLGGAALDLRHYCDALLDNNVIAINDSGIQQDSTCLVTLRYTDVYGNGSGRDFVGLSSPAGTYGNISADPLYVNRAGGDYHLAAGSPAVDAGDTGLYNFDQVDLDKTPRVQGPRVDMGAYERAGAPGVFLNFDVNVSGGAAPGLLGSQPTIRVIDNVGATITGYSGSVTIALKPGFGTIGATLSGTTTVPVVNGVAQFTDLAIDKGGTNYYLTASIPDHGGADSSAFTMTIPVVRVSATGSDYNDGATWAAPKRYPQSAINQCGSTGAVWLKAGVYLGTFGVGTPVSILGGFAGTETADTQRNPAANVTTLDAMGLNSVVSVYAQSTDKATIDGFTLTGGTGYGGGMIINSGAPIISNNTFLNNVTIFGGGILAFGSTAHITRNRFIGNSASLGGGGVYYAYCTGMVIDNNLFAGNSNQYQDGSAMTGYGSTVTITNNTLVGNTGTGGVLGLQGSAAVIENNIVANNGSGVTRSGDSTAALTLTNNDVYNNTAYNYENMTAGANSLSADPLFVNAVSGNYHLSSSSPCIDAGDDTVVPTGALDLGGAARTEGAHVDMGAYETVASLYGLVDVVRALRIAGGLVTATSTDFTHLNVETTTASLTKIDLRDAARLARKVNGLDTNP
jgi:hypothetical protein